jgi:hypothetical protein
LFDFGELALEFGGCALGGRSAGVGRVFVLIGLLEFVEVAGDGEVDGFDEFVEFGLGEAAGGAVDGFDESAVDGDKFPAEESQ